MRFQPTVLIFHYFLKFSILKTLFLSFLIIVPFSIDCSIAAEPYWRSYDPNSGQYIPRTKEHLDSVLLMHENSTDLMKADLRNTDLTNANLQGAILMEADLRHANLTNANLYRATLKYALLDGANLKNAIFEPDFIPSPEHIAYAQNLDHLQYLQSPSKLILLKKSFQEEGFRDAARQINAACHRELFRHNPDRVGFIKMILFDWTCEYGTNTNRLLWLIFYIWIVCTCLYWLSLHIRIGFSGLYLLYSMKKINTGDDHLQVRKLFYEYLLRSKNYRSILRLILLILKVIIIACLFSLMSAFNIGFREIHIGRWIRLLHFREFEIKARGWPRTISRIQSVLSFYFFALWLLTLFGNPFDYW